MVWYSCLLKSFPHFVVIHTVKGFSIVNKAEVDVFLEFPCFLNDLANVGNVISGSSAFSKPSLNIWKLLFYVSLKPSFKDLGHNLTSMWNEHSCLVVWTFFGIAILWDYNENWPFPVLWPLLSFPNLLAYWVRYFHSIIFSVHFSRSVVSDSLWPHESQHARPPCPSPTPGVHSDSRPSSQ